jgi:hypothetical protein
MMDLKGKVAYVFFLKIFYTDLFPSLSLIIAWSSYQFFFTNSRYSRLLPPYQCQWHRCSSELYSLRNNFSNIESMSSGRAVDPQYSSYRLFVYRPIHAFNVARPVTLDISTGCGHFLANIIDTGKACHTGALGTVEACLADCWHR